MMAMPRASRCPMTASMGMFVRKQRSLLPGMGCSAFGSKSRPRGVQVDLLGAEPQCEASVRECLDRHAQHVGTEGAGFLDRRDSQHQLAQRPDRHWAASDRITRCEQWRFEALCSDHRLCVVKRFRGCRTLGSRSSPVDDPCQRAFILEHWSVPFPVAGKNNFLISKNFIYFQI